jgi:hypothetical protein
MSDRIMTKHPEGKSGVNIELHKYEQVKNTILTLLERKREMTFSDLNREAAAVLRSDFDGKIPWYVVTVKLDLEARGIIARVNGTGPQRLRLTK